MSFSLSFKKKGLLSGSSRKVGFLVSLITVSSASASVVMLAEPDGAGGFTLTASGFLDFDEFTFASNNTNTTADTRVGQTIRTLRVNQPTSLYLAPGSEINPTIGAPVTPMTDVAGTTASFTLFNGSIRISGFNFNGGLTGIVPFDFTMSDDFHRGDINEFVDGHVVWDSNGFATPGGQTITFRTTPVPEPSVALLGLFGAVFAFRRRRA